MSEQEEKKGMSDQGKGESRPISSYEELEQLLYKIQNLVLEEMRETDPLNVDSNTLLFFSSVIRDINQLKIDMNALFVNLEADKIDL